MMDQFLLSIQKAMMNQAQTTTFTIANTRAVRKEFISFACHIASIQIPWFIFTDWMVTLISLAILV